MQLTAPLECPEVGRGNDVPNGGYWRFSDICSAASEGINVEERREPAPAQVTGSSPPATGILAAERAPVALGGRLCGELRMTSA